MSISRFTQVFRTTVYKENLEIRRHHLRDWQKTAVFEHLDERFTFTQAGPGSGKARKIIASAMCDVIRSGYKRKQLLCAPQGHLVKSFSGLIPVTLPGDYLATAASRKFRRQWDRQVVKGQTYFKFDFHIQGLETFANRRDGSVDKLKQWLLASPAAVRAGSDPRIISGLVAACSNQTLVLAVAELREEGKLDDALKHLSVYLDEAHHISNVSDWSKDDDADSEMDDSIGTRLGLFCTDLLSSGVKTSALHLITATPFRGDHQDLLNKAVRDDFKKYELDFLVYWAMTKIEEYTNSFTEYPLGGDPLDDIIMRIKADPNHYSMVFVPNIRNGWRRADPGGARLKNFFERLRRIYPKDPNTGLSPVLDLVSEDGREERKQRLFDEPANPAEAKKRSTSVRVVVACQLGREGTDWPWCDRLYNTSVENSLNRAIQTMGRTWRNCYPDKTNVVIHSYYSEFSLDDDEREDKLNERMNVLLLAMHYSEFFNPLVMPGVYSPSIPQATGGTPSSSTIIPEASAINQIGRKAWEEMFREVITMHEVETARGRELTSVKVGHVLKKHGVTEHIPEITNYFFRKIVQYQGDGMDLAAQNNLDLSFLDEAGFRQLQEVHGHTSLLTFAGEYGLEEQREFRRIVMQFMNKEQASDKQVFENNFTAEPERRIDRAQLNAHRRRLKTNRFKSKELERKFNALWPQGYRSRSGAPGENL